MTTPLIPDAIDNAADNMDRILNQSVKMHNTTLQNIKKVLSMTKKSDGTFVTIEDIASRRSRLSGLHQFLSSTSDLVTQLSGTAPASVIPTVTTGGIIQPIPASTTSAVTTQDAIPAPATISASSTLTPASVIPATTGS
jgi:hypothetical protein